MSEEDNKKSKVIHTRVDEHLDEALRTRASRLGVSVSNLVRNVLVNAFGLVEGVVADSNEVARAARGEGASSNLGGEGRDLGGGVPSFGRGPGRVLGWQELTLALNAVCGRCNELLPRGSQAAAAVTERPGPRTILCMSCFHDEVQP